MEKPATRSSSSQDVVPAGLHVIYGSRTGNSRAAAELARDYSGHLGIESHLVDMNSLNTDEFAGFRNILIAVSTHGEGDPPSVAEKFYNFIHSPEAPDMTGVRFSVLALGDSSYRDFCKTGKDIRNRFLELGADEILAIAECDIDYEENAKKWVREAITLFEKLLPKKYKSGSNGFAFEINKSASDYDNAFYARVTRMELLTNRRYDKRTLHLELDMKGFPDKFSPGDSFGVYTHNPRPLVDRLLKTLGFKGASVVGTGTNRKLLKDALLLTMR